MPSLLPRVLIIAEAANPEWVSVPLVGWSIANALRGVTNAHLVTQVRNREAILRAGLSESSDFTAIDTEPLMKPLWRVATALGGESGKAWTAVTAIQSLAYPYFEHLVWKRFGERIRAHEFDIVHRVTPLSPTAPSLLAKRCAAANVPFVMGPLNGGVPWPKGFTAERHKEREWLSYVRSAYKLIPGSRSTWKHAFAIVAASKFTQSDLPANAQAKSIYIPENAVDATRFTSAIEPARYDRLKLCFIGRLVPYKGPDIALEAAAPFLRDGRASLDIIGDGPMMPALREQAAHLDIAASVSFRGWIPHAEVAQAARSSTVFLFPSVREFGGGAVIEAMALGLVPIVMNYGGPGEIVTDHTGFRIGIGSRDRIISDIATLVGELAGKPDRLASLAAAGTERIRSLYTWDRKAEQLLEVYRFARGERDRPEFPFLVD